MRELDKVLDDGEKVLWEGKPNFWPYFFTGSIVVALFGFIFMAVGLVVLIGALSQGEYWVIFFPHFWVGALIFFGVPIYKLLVFSKTYYAITNKRIIIQSGVIGRDFNFIDFDKVTNASVDVGFFDKVLHGKSGSIQVFSAGAFTSATPYVFCNITNPYEVFKFFKKVSHDVKTDIEYPNAYRPKTNPGYGTVYSTAKKAPKKASKKR